MSKTAPSSQVARAFGYRGLLPAAHPAPIGLTEMVVEGLEPGTILADKYRVERVLGAGGMGVVLEAHHLHLDERVAIKTLLPEMLPQTDAVERFLREARAAVRIKSEHVARVRDVGRLSSGAPYMVMEFLEGQDLAERIAEHGPLEIEQAVEFVLQACEALAEAHALGIVHRDLKPANLFCVKRADGLLSVKLLDFGISKATGSGTDFTMTKTTAVLGSPYYMSPEQMVSAKNADAQSDIWSLGAVLFELLTGQVPFMADTLPELVLRVSGAPAPNVSSLRANVPPRLREVVARCLEKDRSKRYPHIAELALALAPLGPARRAAASAERISRVLEQAGVSVSKRPNQAELDLTQVQGSPASAPAESSRAAARGAAAAAVGTVTSFGHGTLPGRRSGGSTKLWWGLGVAAVALSAAAWPLVPSPRPSAVPSSAAIPAARATTSVITPNAAEPRTDIPPLSPAASSQAAASNRTAADATAAPPAVAPRAPEPASAKARTSIPAAKKAPAVAATSSSSAPSSASGSSAPAPATSLAPNASSSKPASALGGRL